MVAGGKKVSGCEIKIWLDYAICGRERGFECLSLNVLKKKKTHLKRGARDSCWVWVSVSMSSRRHGWVLDKSHVIPSSEQLKEFYFHHLEFWSWQCAELRIKCQFSEKSSEMCHATACTTRCCEACLHDTWYQHSYHLDIWPAEPEISLGRLFSDIITVSL